MRSPTLAAAFAAALGTALGIAMTMARPPEARACSIGMPEPHETDPAEVGADTSPPSVAVTLEDVRRGRGPERTGACRSGASSCDDDGYVYLALAPGDDRTPADKVGYRIRVVDGAAPKFHGGFLDTPIRPEPWSSSLHVALHWNDGDTDDQEALDFVIEVTPIDLAGNEGAPVRVEVHDPGSGGCGAGSDAASPMVLSLLAWLAATLPSRRRA